MLAVSDRVQTTYRDLRKELVKSNLTEEIHSITAGIRSRELCQAPICASAFIPLAGVVGESISFSKGSARIRTRD